MSWETFKAKWKKLRQEEQHLPIRLQTPGLIIQVITGIIIGTILGIGFNNVWKENEKNNEIRFNKKIEQKVEEIIKKKEQNEKN